MPSTHVSLRETAGIAFQYEVSVVPCIVYGLTGGNSPDLIVNTENGISVLRQDPQHPGTFLAAANYAVGESRCQTPQFPCIAAIQERISATPSR